MATGAPAVVPDWALRPDGTTYDGVGAVKTLDDGAAWLEQFASADDDAHVVVVGAGYVGVEVAEAALRRGFGVTVLTRTRGMAMLEDEMSDLVNAGLRDAGAELVLGAEVTGLDTEGDRVTGVRWDGGSREADLVVVAIGVRPATEFLAGTGIEMTDNGALRPDPHGRVTDHVWSAGDCCEVRRRLDDAWVFRPLGTHANKHGRALGDSLAGGSLTFDGMVDTSITRFSFGDVQPRDRPHRPVPRGRRGGGPRPGRAGHRGLDGQRLHAGGRADRAVGDGRPDDPPAARRAGRRGRGAGKRIDAAAAVLWAEGTVDDLAWMDLAYAPPFATAWEILQVAARRVAERL